MTREGYTHGRKRPKYCRRARIGPKIAEASESDLDNAIKNSTQYIEPAMIVFMGVTIGGLAISLLLPIFNVASVMSGSG